MKITITIEMDEKEFKNVESKESERKTEQSYSQYARFFDEVCFPIWKNDMDINLLTLRRIQERANDRLKNEGYLLLNDVYEMLGIPRSRKFNRVGWRSDLDGHDGYVDFGIFKEYNAFAVNGVGNSILLDFNVDGEIW